MSILKYLMIISFIYGCSSGKEKEQNYIVYYANRNVKFIGDTINGEFEGSFKEFYENGVLKNWNTYHKGMLHGRCINYSPNGNPKSDMYYVKDKPSGIQYNFYVIDSARIKDKFIFVNNENFYDKPILVSLRQYDEKGNLIKDESRVNCYIEMDTFQLGERFSVKFSLSNPEFNKHRIYIGNFNRGLELIDSSGFQKHEGQGHSAELFFIAEKKGNSFLRGYMDDFKIETLPDSGYNEVSTINNWFDVEYYVK